MNTIREIVQGVEFWEDLQFSGTENYYKVSMFNLLATDGAKTLFETKSCYWIADIISSYLPKIRLGVHEAYIIVDKEKSSCKFYLTNGDDEIIVKQTIPYTDLDISVRLYVQRSGGKTVVFLPSEY